ncbi:MAG: alpha/beta fold hydrolase [Oscillospiraceae bacterium]|jgi:triacylglycerol lipase|nr:alpha/beta fold hydrolase [Oscillospiraceae bacterium]
MLCADGNICGTRYPLLLLHGAGARDFKRANYWGRIPEALERRGASVYHGYQDGWGTVEYNAGVIRDRVNDILRGTGCEKLNIIAHSKGGLEARYLISALGMANHIASLTTIATPHRGSKTYDIFYRMPKFLYKVFSAPIDLVFRMLGDKNPDFFTASRIFSTKEAELFNEMNPDSERVYYQSYAAVMRNSFSDILMAVPHFFVRLVEGENDGLVTPGSAKWANFKGILRGAANRGASHIDVTDARRRRLTIGLGDGCVSDICDVYVDIAAQLKNMGF